MASTGQSSKHKSLKYRFHLAKLYIRILWDDGKKYLKTHKFDVCMMLMAFWALLAIWAITPGIEYTFIPTIVNGASTTTALLLGFIGLLLTISFSYLHLNPQKMKSRLFWTIAGCSGALGFIGVAYLSYVLHDVDFYYILKLSLSGIVVAILLASTLAQSIYSLLVDTPQQ